MILFYLWLCVVSLYQTLKEIKNLGSDQVKIMGFQEDGQPYGKFETAEDYNPHSDDYPAGGADMDGPPSYRSGSGLARSGGVEELGNLGFDTYLQAAKLSHAPI